MPLPIFLLILVIGVLFVEAILFSRKEKPMSVQDTHPTRRPVLIYCSECGKVHGEALIVPGKDIGASDVVTRVEGYDPKQGDPIECIFCGVKGLMFGECRAG